MIDSNTIQTQLKQIIDPDLGRDIVSLGFIKDLYVSDGNVRFKIELTTPACPIKNYFYEQAYDIVSELEGVKSVDIQMTARKNKRIQPNLQKVKNIIAIASCKGGVGKSTIAASIAYSLADRGYKIGLLDADIFGPSVPTLFNTQSEPILQTDGKLTPLKQGNLKLISFGNILGDAPAVMRGPMVSRYISSLLLETDWDELDYLFIDMPPGTGDIQLTIAQTIPLDGAVMITTASNLSLVDVARGIQMFESVKIPIISLVNNMAYFTCHSCDEKHFLFGETDLQERFGFETVIELPFIKEKAQNIKEIALSKPMQKLTNQIIRELGKRQVQQDVIPNFSHNENIVTINWPDGSKNSFNNHDLRLQCRCAHCRDEINGKILVKEEKIPADIQTTKIIPLGNYAISIAWNDGHSTGIYPYKLLKELAATNQSI